MPTFELIEDLGRRPIGTLRISEIEIASAWHKNLLTRDYVAEVRASVQLVLQRPIEEQRRLAALAFRHALQGLE